MLYDKELNDFGVEAFAVQSYNVVHMIFVLENLENIGENEVKMLVTSSVSLYKKVFKRILHQGRTISGPNDKPYTAILRFIIAAEN